jgi:hypothetical protein
MYFTESIDYGIKSRKEGVYIDPGSSSLSWGGWNCFLDQKHFPFKHQLSTHTSI